MIAVKPYGGLANRMRAIDSCYWLAKELDTSLHLIWENTFELNCSFHKLFELPEEFSYEERHVGRSELFLAKRIRTFLRKSGIRIFRGYDQYFLEEDIDLLMRNGFDMEVFRNYSKIFISTTSHFLIFDQSFNFFKPIERLQRIIDERIAHFSDNTIGIHIRRTDNAMSRKYSPLNAFIEYIDAVLDNHSSFRFFLATDSLEVEKDIKKRYGNRIITYEKEQSRNLEKGIHDALVDMYCLANCQRIIGSYFSSFSEVAAQINNIELNQIYREEA